MVQQGYAGGGGGAASEQNHTHLMLAAPFPGSAPHPIAINQGAPSHQSAAGETSPAVGSSMPSSTH
jgi:hypothetical protein